MNGNNCEKNKLTAILAALMFVATGFLGVCCVASEASAQVAYVPPEGIYGYVYKPDGSPLVGATITDQSTGAQVTSDSNGYWGMSTNVQANHVIAYWVGLLYFPDYGTMYAHYSGSADITCSSRTGMGTGNIYCQLYMGA